MATLPKIPFTRAGYAKIQAEETRLSQDRGGILVRLQAAREMGDLSENGAYKAARFELSDTDRRLRQLHYLLRFGYLAPPPTPGIVGFGSQVTLEYQGKLVTYTLVNQYESNPTKHLLSIDSPLGRLLLGKKPGDQISLDLPSGPQLYLIKSLE